MNLFLKSATYKEWKLRQVKNEINCMIGALESESDLKRSMISNGVVLYGEYQQPIKGKNYALFSLKPISEKNKRYRILRKLFGRKDKHTQGLVKSLGGKQISTRVFVVPLEQASVILHYLRNKKAEYFMMEISSDYDF